MFARRTEWNRSENAYATALRRARERGVKLLDLTVSNPTECGFNFDSATILSGLNNPESLRYDPQPRGLLEAREAVAEYYNSSKLGAAHHVAPEQIFLTTSTSEAYTYLFRLLCNPGDEVLAPRPSYPLFEFLTDIQDVELRNYPLFYDHGWHIDVDTAAKSLAGQTRALLIVNPNNPTGSFLHRSEMQRLDALCAERDVALICDEVFLDYEVEAGAHVSAAFSARSCLSFAVSGLSKISCLPQLKLGWIVVAGPSQLRIEAESRLEIIADTYLSVNAPIQHGLPALLNQRRTMQPQLISRIKDNLALLDRELRAAPAIERLKVEGGWYAILRVPATQSDEEFAIAMMNRFEVLVHPGHFYDFPSDGYLVLSLITPKAEFEEGVRRILHASGS